MDEVQHGLLEWNYIEIITSDKDYVSSIQVRNLQTSGF